MTGATLSLDHVSKRFGGVVAVDDLCLKVAGGTFLTILGASGSGKSTTLTLIAGFVSPDTGSIAVNGRPMTSVPPHRRNFGVVFQNYALFPHMSVFDNVAFPLKMRRQGRQQIARQVAAALDMVRLGGLDARLPRQLSGGQQQRVALARAIVGDPLLLLMDEPLSALDKQLREHMQVELKNIQQRLGITVVYVTHDQTEALVMSDQIAVLRHGRLHQLGTPRDIYDRPATRYVADFIGESNLLEGVVGSATAAACRVRCDGLELLVATARQTTPGEKVVVSLRPERLRLAETDRAPGAAGTVEQILYAGDALKLRVRVGRATSLSVRLPRTSAAERLVPGAAIALDWDGDAAILVAADE